jgi:DhnA family fructose-bisphosphate aldolase class Ia
MDARSGRKIRLARILNSTTGKGIVVACSHPVFAGPLPGLATAAAAEHSIRALALADGVLVAPGWVERLEDFFAGRDRPSLILHMDWKSAGRSFLKTPETILCPLFTIEEAIAAGADGVMTYLYYGQNDVALEREEIRRNAEVARACDRWGLVHIIEPRSASEKTHPESVSPGVLAAYARIGAEVGGTIIKTIYPGVTEGLAEVVAACPVPVLVAGGPGGSSADEVVAMARAIMSAGAHGLVFGRKVYQAEDPAALLKRLREVVHGPDGRTA